MSFVSIFDVGAECLIFGVEGQEIFDVVAFVAAAIFSLIEILNISRRKLIHFNPDRTRGGLIEIVYLQTFNGGASARCFANYL